MKIALAHDFLNQFGGAERVLKAFCEIYPQAPVFTLFYDDRIVDDFFPKSKFIATYLQRFRWLKSHHKYMLPLLPRVAESLDFSGFEVILSDSTAWVKGIRKPEGAIHICYCNSPTRFLWDWRGKYLDEQKIFGLKRWVVERLLDRIAKWDLESKERVDFWIANSKNTQGRIKKYYRKESTVINPPVDTRQFKISSNQKNYFFLISRLSAYKKIDLAIKAFNKLSLPLLIAGQGPEMERLKSIAKPNIKFLGFISDEEAVNYYSNCRAFIFPTFDEDFGLTPVEAMASGRPVIAAGRGGTRETIIEGKTGIFFNEETPESLVEAVNKFIQREKDFNSKEIKKHAQQFDIEVFKEKIKNFVQEKYQVVKNKAV